MKLRKIIVAIAIVISVGITGCYTDKPETNLYDNYYDTDLTPSNNGVELTQ